MGDMSIGGGIGALAFWGFVAVCVWAGIWNGVRKREAEHATLRKLIENGESAEAAAALLRGGGRESELRAYGIATVFIAAGIALAAWPLSPLSLWAFPAMMAAAALTGFAGAGLLAASRFGVVRA